jgi:RNA polymerase sigma factor (sigma-70 family)
MRHLELLMKEGSLASLADAQLLERFVTERDAASFEVLMLRHGPMVLGVCRGVLKDPNDAQDAFQATFLIMVRKARSLWAVGVSLGSWLHRVAYRIAVRANVEAARRRSMERRAQAMGRPVSIHDRLEPELLFALHEEICRLPEKYRAPIVLCHLERMTHEQAAGQLGWTVGAVRGRVARGREVLRKRLTRRGLTLSAGLLITVLAEQAAPAAIPKAWMDATTVAAIALAAGRATAIGLTAAMLRAQILARAWAGASLMAALGLGIMAGLAGANWLNPEEDLDARALALANRLKNVTVPIPQPLPARPPRTQDFDPVPPPSRGYQWVAFEDDLVSTAGDRLLRYHSWSGAILRRSGVAGTFHVHEDGNGDAIVTVSHSLESGAGQVVSCRPVVFDKQRRRFVPRFERTTRCMSEFGDMAAIDRFRLSHDFLPFDRINAVGVERMSPEVLQHRAPQAPDVAAHNVGQPRPFRSPSVVGASPGCSWVIGPLPVGRGDWAVSASGQKGGVVCALSTTLQGVLNIDIVYPSRTQVHNNGGCDEEYRPVVIDTSGRRHVLIGTQPYCFESGAAASLAATVFSSVRPSPLFGGIFCMAPVDRRTYGSADLGVFRLKLGLAVREKMPQAFSIRPSDVALIGVERLGPETLRNARVSSFLEVLRLHENWFLESEARFRLRADHAIDQPVLDPSLRADFERVACLGAYEKLLNHMRQASKTPEPLRSARIRELVRFVKHEESLRGTSFENRVDPTLVYAYEIAQKPSGGVIPTN